MKKLTQEQMDIVFETFRDIPINDYTRHTIEAFIDNVFFNNPKPDRNDDNTSKEKVHKQDTPVYRRGNIIKAEYVKMSKEPYLLGSEVKKTEFIPGLF